MRFWKFIKGINYKKDDTEARLEILEKMDSSLNNDFKEEKAEELESLSPNDIEEKSDNILEETTYNNSSEQRGNDGQNISSDKPSDFSINSSNLTNESQSPTSDKESSDTIQENTLDNSNDNLSLEQDSFDSSEQKKSNDEKKISNIAEEDITELDEKIGDTPNDCEPSNDTPSSQNNQSERQKGFDLLNENMESDFSQNSQSDSQTSDEEYSSESILEEILELQEDDGKTLESEKIDETIFEQSLVESEENLESEEKELSSEDFIDEKYSSSENEVNIEENKKRLELLKKFRDKIEEYAKEKAKVEKHKNHVENVDVEESVEEDYELSEETNQFIDKLKDLPSFENRDRGPGYSIDTESFSVVPESVIRTLITKFLNQRFCKRDTDLNVRSNSLEKSHGFYKWEVKDVVIHLETEQLTKIPNDKYGYQYANGKNETVPLSFYFDMSGSMSEYTNMLAVIAIELLKKGVKVLIGFNERVEIQIDSITKNITVEELARFLEENSYDEKMQSKIKHKRINRNIDNYLIEAKAEKCCVFSDFDPLNEIINLSHKTQVYWFCFENEYYIENISNYNGFVYPVHDIESIAAGLVKVNENRFETLLYVENPKKLRR